MAVTFLEPGGDATFNVATKANGGFWGSIIGSPAVATDFVHGNHVKSLSYAPGSNNTVTAGQATVENVLSDSGSRFSIYTYFNALPATNALMFVAVGSFNVRINSSGVLGLYDTSANQIGTNGPTLTTGKWYRISLAYTITSTTVNRFELFVDGISGISVTNATLTSIGATTLQIGNQNFSSLDMRTSDHYIDNSSSLVDTGNIWVTAKRPNANGTTNGFTTQIGSGGSGYGSGHSPQVNERALSTTNGWSMVGAGSAITEEYSIEGKSVGDVNITFASIIDYLGWVYASSLLSETAQIIVGGVNSNISLTSTNTMFTKVAGSTSYPAGNTDIGIITSTTVTTVSLYECGIIVAYTPSVSPLPTHFYP